MLTPSDSFLSERREFVVGTAGPSTGCVTVKNMGEMGIACLFRLGLWLGRIYSAKR